MNVYIILYTVIINEHSCDASVASYNVKTRFVRLILSCLKYVIDYSGRVV